MLTAPAGTKGFPTNSEKEPLNLSTTTSSQFIRKLYKGSIFSTYGSFEGLSELGVVLNRDCNYKCSYCYYPPYSANSNFNSTCGHLCDTLVKLTEESPHLETVAVIGREPLLEFELLTRVVHSISRSGRKTGLVTNGMLLDQYAREVSGLPINYLDISFHLFLEGQAKIGHLERIHRIVENAAFTVNCGLILMSGNQTWVESSLEVLHDNGIRNFFINIYVDEGSHPDFLLDYPSFLNGMDLLRAFCSDHRDTNITVDIWGEKLPFFQDLFENGYISKDSLYVDEYLVYAPVADDLDNLNYKFLINMPCFATMDYEGFLYFGPDDAIYGRKDRAVHHIKTPDDIRPALLKYNSKDNPFYAKVSAALDSPCRDKPCLPFCLGGNPYCSIRGGSV